MKKLVQIGYCVLGGKMVDFSRLSSFGRQGDRTSTFGGDKPCRNPLPTLAVQLSGERVFCFQQSPVTYSGSPPVTLPPAASGNQGSQSCLLSGLRNKKVKASTRESASSRGVLLDQPLANDSRAGKPVSRNDGWLHAWEGFVPRLGDNVFTQDSPSQEGFNYNQVTTK